MGVEDIKKYTALSQLMMLGISKETAIEYIDVRKSKKEPLTKSAILILFSEAEKASISAEQAIKTCCEESWRGFKAEWYLRLKPSSSASVSPIKNGQFKTAAQQREENNNAVGDRFIEKMLGATLNTNEIIIEGEVLNG